MDEAWEAVANILPEKRAIRGAMAATTVSFWRPFSGLPEQARLGATTRPEFGKWYTTYTRYHRWAKKEFAARLRGLAENGAVELLLYADRLRWASRRR